MCQCCTLSISLTTNQLQLSYKSLSVCTVPQWLNEALLFPASDQLYSQPSASDGSVNACHIPLEHTTLNVDLQIFKQPRHFAVSGIVSFTVSPLRLRVCINRGKACFMGSYNRSSFREICTTCFVLGLGNMKYSTNGAVLTYCVCWDTFLLQ